MSNDVNLKHKFSVQLNLKSKVTNTSQEAKGPLDVGSVHRYQKDQINSFSFEQDMDPSNTCRSFDK